MYYCLLFYTLNGVIVTLIFMMSSGFSFTEIHGSSLHLTFLDYFFSLFNVYFKFLSNPKICYYPIRLNPCYSVDHFNSIFVIRKPDLRMSGVFRIVFLSPHTRRPLFLSSFKHLLSHSSFFDPKRFQLKSHLSNFFPLL